MGRFQVQGSTVPQEEHNLTGVLGVGVGDSEVQEPCAHWPQSETFSYLGYLLTVIGSTSTIKTQADS